MQNPLAAIPPRYRVYVYTVLALVGLALGATQVYIAAVAAAAGATVVYPAWLVGSLAVVPFLMSGLGFTAATHVPAAPDAAAGRHREPVS